MLPARSLVLSLLLLFLFTQCGSQTGKTRLSSYLLLHTDTMGNYWYTDVKGVTVIPPGRYNMCFTDTFRNYAIVALHWKFIGINRNGKELYEVFPYDNGPDYIQEGLFRIQDSMGNIGYADSATGQVVIPPQFGAAFPFEKDRALAGCGCISTYDDEHSAWLCARWWYIDKKGKQIPGTMRLSGYANSSGPYLPWFTDNEHKQKFKNLDIDENAVNADSVIAGLNQLYHNVPLRKVKISGDTLYTNISPSYYLAERMGSTGASEYITQAVVNMLAVKEINYVNVDFEAGEHATPGTWSRKDFDDLKERAVCPK